MGSTTFRKFVELRTQVRQFFVVGPGSTTPTFALIGALSLYSIDNVKGTSAYLSLSTWKLVHRYRGTGLPMTENVIETMNMRSMKYMRLEDDDDGVNNEILSASDQHTILAVEICTSECY